MKDAVLDTNQGSPANPSGGDQPVNAAPPPRNPTAKKKGTDWWAEVKGLFWLLLIVLGFHSFIAKPFYIPSESMTDTLNVDDRVLVNKLSYRIGDIERGDIVVFEKPPDAPGSITDFIKRVAALPGETITFVDGAVFIDGQLLNEPYLDGETRPNSEAIVSEGCTNTPAADRCTLAEGWYFVLGDNRDNSTDSRSFGPVEEDAIVWPDSSRANRPAGLPEDVLDEVVNLR